MAEQYFVSRVCEGQKQIYKRPWYIVEKKKLWHKLNSFPIRLA